MIALGGFITSMLAVALRNSCVSSLQGCLASIYTPWFAAAGLFALFVLVVLAMIYGISPLVGRSDMRAWTKIKIYDTLFSLVLIMIFGYATNLIYSIPVGIFSQAQLVSPLCSSSPNIYALSICDMYQFNAYTADTNAGLYYLLLSYGALQSVIHIGVSYGNIGVSQVTGQGVGAPSGSISLDSNLMLLPKDLGFKYLGHAIDIVYGFVLTNYIELILLSSSAIIFTILMTLGLIARIFGVTRTFGGAMIAFALGLGVIFPLITSIAYGFVDYGMYQTAQQAGLHQIIIGGLLFGPGLLSSLTGSTALGLIFRLATIGAALTMGNLITGPLFIYVGLNWIGLTFMPLIVFITVDVFIIDFSQAIGERMSFLSMLTRIL